MGKKVGFSRHRLKAVTMWTCFPLVRAVSLRRCLQAEPWSQNMGQLWLRVGAHSCTLVFCGFPSASQACLFSLCPSLLQFQRQHSFALPLPEWIVSVRGNVWSCCWSFISSSYQIVYRQCGETGWWFHLWSWGIMADGAVRGGGQRREDPGSLRPERTNCLNFAEGDSKHFSKSSL